jgi:hypothetical protein
LSRVASSPFFEQRVGDEPFGFEEPAEEQARDESDQALLDVGVAVAHFGGHRELHLRCRPEEPVGDLLVELAREAFDIEGVVEAVGGFGNRGLPVQEFLQAEVEFGEPFEGGACGCAEGVGQGAQFGFAVGSLPRPCERHGRGDACLADDIAQQVFGVGGREGALHGAPRGEGRRARSSCQRTQNTGRLATCAMGSKVSARLTGAPISSDSGANPRGAFQFSASQNRR